MTQLLEQAIEKVQSLPPIEQDRIARQLLDAVESRMQTGPPTPKPRRPGLGKGRVEMAEDFDDPLPDSFWLGEG